MSLRFILKRREDNSYDAVTERLETLDVDVPELERALRQTKTGQGGPGYLIVELVGVELRESTP